MSDPRIDVPGREWCLCAEIDPSDRPCLGCELEELRQDKMLWTEKEWLAWFGALKSKLRGEA